MIGRCILNAKYFMLFSDEWLLTLRALSHQFLIITDSTVKNLIGDAWLEHLVKNGLDVHLLHFPAGESSKNRATKELLEDQMFSLGCGRDTALIALGGGVVSDLGGFLASTYCRGIPLVLIPTTLLAMVDAAFGGKTGVNTASGKNLIGTFYLPDKVLIDVSLLSTL